MKSSAPFGDAKFEPLREKLHGELLTPDEEGYDEARSIWNSLIDRRPAAIARCTGTADVVNSVDFARENDLVLSVKAGGHHVSGSAVCHDGLTIDLGQMRGIRVDPAARRMRVQPGATVGDVDHETQAFGLAVPGGQDPNIGVAGLTLGGGVGWLSSKYGLTCDNLLSADVVTAAGEFVHADEHTNRDLFWALRGGGGNFGIVTSFEFELHEVGPEIFAGTVIYPLRQLASVARRYRDFISDAPRGVRSLFGSMVVPETSSYPRGVRGERVAMIISFFAGPPAVGRDVLAPLRDSGDAIVDTIRGRSYKAFQRAGTSRGAMRTYLRSQYLPEFSDDAIATVVEYVRDAPSAGATVFVSPRRGAETDPTASATAYPHRDPAHHLLIETRWNDPDEDGRHVEWTRSFHEAVRPFTNGEVSVNFMTDDEPRKRVEAAYGENYGRLVSVKNEWDPENLFSMNQNVRPGSG